MSPGAETSGAGHHADEAHTNGRIAVVVGSTRPTRICRGIAEWVRGVAQEGSPLHYELIDLAEIDLPFLDEPLKASLHQYEHEHTRVWSRIVSSYDGFVFVFPQYNWGYPAPLKNALDFLYREWHDRPAASVTYGTRGGSKGAQQFHSVLEGVHMRPLAEGIEIFVTDEDVDEDWQLRDLDATLQPYLEQVRRLDVQMVEALRGTAASALG
ncbi:MAG: NAD(P)H-dependent oxidoreductase [Solirubrobacteraceae bacterium]